MPTVFLVTCAQLPDGEMGGHLLTAALAERGVEARWVVWDDPQVDWAEPDLVAVRSTWDYTERAEEFLAWVRSVPRLLNDADTVVWNHDKAYLVGLADRLPVVPTQVLDDPADLGPERPVVVKPRVGASGEGLVVVDAPEAPDLGHGPWVVQPLVESIRTEGESSLYVFGGRAVSQFDKLPGPGEVRVHEEYGGTTARVPLDDSAVALAERAVAEVGAPACARVDLVHWQGEWAVGELELIEPGLYLEVDPVNADAFADLVVGVLAQV